MNLVSLEAAMRHCNASSFEEDEIDSKRFLSSAIVLDYITDDPNDWYEAEDDGEGLSSEDSPPLFLVVPGNVRSAVLLVLGELFLNKEASDSQPLSDTVKALLSSFRLPTVK